MLSVGKNRHRWKLSLSDRRARFLEEQREHLVWAWELDKEAPKSFPVNTANVLHEIKEQLAKKKEPTDLKGSKLVFPVPAPKTLAELISDRMVEVVYESQNTDTYLGALKEADRGNRSKFRKILRAVEKAYIMHQMGEQAGTPPKVDFLHRGLLETAELSGLAYLKNEGILEFIDDLCPCGKLHSPDAIRKLRKRLGSSS